MATQPKSLQEIADSVEQTRREHHASVAKEREDAIKQARNGVSPAKSMEGRPLAEQIAYINGVFATLDLQIDDQADALLDKIHREQAQLGNGASTSTSTGTSTHSPSNRRTAATPNFSEQPYSFGGLGDDPRDKAMNYWDGTTGTPATGKRQSDDASSWAAAGIVLIGVLILCALMSQCSGA